MLSERLREETHEAHVNLEKLIVPRLKELDSSYSYVRLLTLFYGYFKPVEEKIGQYINKQVLQDVEERRKSEMILQDMQAVGQIEQTHSCDDLPKIENTTTALGAMYVLEGSTLGGQFISKMIAEKLNLVPAKSIRFFSGYGVHTFQKWSVFKDFLNNYSDSDVVEDEVIDAANQTFTKFKNWIELN